MRVGLFGGTFDPVHYGHLLLAEVAREQCDLDEVWFVPAAVPPHKQDVGSCLGRGSGGNDRTGRGRQSRDARKPIRVGARRRELHDRHAALFSRTRLPTPSCSFSWEPICSTTCPTGARRKKFAAWRSRLSRNGRGAGRSTTSAWHPIASGRADCGVPRLSDRDAADRPVQHGYPPAGGRRAFDPIPHPPGSPEVH